MQKYSKAAICIALLLSLPLNANARMGDRIKEYLAHKNGEASAPAATQFEKDISYGNDPLQKYDVYYPKLIKSAPVIIMVHGGAWKIGDKSNPGVASPKGDYWLNKGYVFVSVNYRMLPDANPLVQASDVASAITSAQSMLAAKGADVSRTVIMGHSAGAHLIALIASNADYIKKYNITRPRAAISLDSAALNVPAIMSVKHMGFYDDAFGNDENFWQAASPAHNLSASSLPIMLVCSSQRKDSCPQANAYAKRAGGLGVTATVLPVDLKHDEINKTLGLQSEYTRSVDAYIASVIR